MGDATVVDRETTGGHELLVDVQPGAVRIHLFEHRDASRRKSTTQVRHRAEGESPARATPTGCDKVACLAMSRHRLLGRLVAPENKRAQTRVVVLSITPRVWCYSIFINGGCGHFPRWEAPWQGDVRLLCLCFP